jgi:hypothetical protein
MEHGEGAPFTDLGRSEPWRRPVDTGFGREIPPPRSCWQLLQVDRTVRCLVWRPEATPEERWQGSNGPRSVHQNPRNPDLQPTAVAKSQFHSHFAPATDALNGAYGSVGSSNARGATGGRVACNRDRWIRTLYPGASQPIAVRDRLVLGSMRRVQHLRNGGSGRSTKASSENAPLWPFTASEITCKAPCLPFFSTRSRATGNPRCGFAAQWGCSRRGAVAAAGERIDRWSKPNSECSNSEQRTAPC